MTTRSRLDVFSAEALSDRDALFLEKSRHRRVDVIVLTCDNVATVAHRRRHCSHGGPTDAKEMNMLERVLHGLRKSEKAYGAKVRMTKNEIPPDLCSETRLL